MKKLLMIVALLLFSIASFADCIIGCHVRYAQQDENQNWDWSETQPVYVHFYSGYELNKGTGESLFNDNSVIAVVEWTDGKYSTVVIKGWTTNSFHITEQDVLYDDATGLQIPYYKGKDLDGKLWYIELN
jgi:hypothetical protein